MSNKLDYSKIREMVSHGGGGTLTSEERTTSATPYTPLQGQTVDGGNNVFGNAVINGRRRRTISLDSPASQKNRAEEQLRLIREDPGRPGHAAISAMNGVDVTYHVTFRGVGGDVEEVRTLSDLDLPNRIADGHVRMSSLDGTPYVQNADFQKAIGARMSNITPLLALSPISVECGWWDSLQGSSGVKFRAISRGETIGVLSTDDERDSRNDLAGYRHDPFTPNYGKMTKEEGDALLASAAKDHNVTANLGRKESSTPASRLVLGHVPYPGKAGKGAREWATRGYACDEVIRYNVISLAGLRAMRFGGEIDDVSARAGLLALSLFMDATLAENVRRLRTGCDLAYGDRKLILDRQDLAPLTEIEAAELLAEAIAESPTGWTSQRVHLTGNPLLQKGFTTEADTK